MSILFKERLKSFNNKDLLSYKKNPIKHKGYILSLLKNTLQEDEKRDYYLQCCLDTAIDLHRKNSFFIEEKKQKVSFGVIRFSLVDSCIECSRYFLNANIPNDIEIRVLPYHSRQILLLRHEIEDHLEEVLCRKEGFEQAIKNHIIDKHIENSKKENIVFIMVCTSIEEVGRDHDFNWAVLEPSSYRSLIQMLGRVLRHTTIEQDIQEYNFTMMEYTLRGYLRGKESPYIPPYSLIKDSGIQNKLPGDIFEIPYNSFKLFNEDSLRDASFKIDILKTPKDYSDIKNLSELEHYNHYKYLCDDTSYGPENGMGYFEGFWGFTALPSCIHKFRASSLEHTVFCKYEEGEITFVEKDSDGTVYPVKNVFNINLAEKLTSEENARLWIHLDYKKLLSKWGNDDLTKSSLKYGELQLPIYNLDVQSSFTYCFQLGLKKC